MNKEVFAKMKAEGISSMLQTTVCGTSKLFLVLLILTLSVGAVQVGVVVKFPQSVHTECINVPEGTDGYVLMNKLSLATEWAFWPSLGHALCKIGDTGCPASNCFCQGWTFWNFYINDELSSVGSDGGSSNNWCWDRITPSSGHYCAKQGDVVGWVWGTWDPGPPGISFEKICAKSKKRFKRFAFSIAPEGEIFTGENTSIIIDDKSRGAERTRTSKKEVLKIFAGENITLINDSMLKDTKLSVYEGVAGMSRKVFSKYADDNGVLSFILKDVREYSVLLEKEGYKYMEFVMVVLEPTTTSAVAK